jgi:cation transport ATPase
MADGSDAGTEALHRAFYYSTLSLLLTLPLAANLIFKWHGLEVFFLGDAAIQTFFGTLQQFLVILPIYREAAVNRVQGGWRLSTAAGGITLLYLAGLIQALQWWLQPGERGGPWFEAAAIGATVLWAGRALLRISWGESIRRIESQVPDASCKQKEETK